MAKESGVSRMALKSAAARRVRSLSDGEAAAMSLIRHCDDCRYALMDAIRTGTATRSCGECPTPPEHARTILSDVFGYSPIVPSAAALALTEGPFTTGTRWVYFVQGEGGGPIKIGSATNIQQRLRDLQIGSPVLLTLLHGVQGDYDLEYALHERFANDRLHGEWFTPSPELLAYIEGLKGTQA
jgi:hypothetical protein